MWFSNFRSFYSTLTTFNPAGLVPRAFYFIFGGNFIILSIEAEIRAELSFSEMVIIFREKTVYGKASMKFLCQKKAIFLIGMFENMPDNASSCVWGKGLT